MRVDFDNLFSIDANYANAAVITQFIQGRNKTFTVPQWTTLLHVALAEACARLLTASFNQPNAQPVGVRCSRSLEKFAVNAARLGDVPPNNAHRGNNMCLRNFALRSPIEHVKKRRHASNIFRRFSGNVAHGL